MLASLVVSAAVALAGGHAAPFSPPDCVGSRHAHQHNGLMLIGRHGSRGLWLASSRGRALKRVTAPRWFEDDINASFAPDGRHAVFERYDNHRQGGSIWTVNLATKKLHRVHRPSGSQNFDEWPVWAPDGRHIAFVREIDGGETGFHGSVVETRPDGSGLRVLYAPAFAPEFPARLLAWSPNGRCLAFYSILPLGQNGDTTEGVVVAPADGGGPAFGIYPKSGTFPGGKTGYPNAVAFSADGTRLFVADDLDLHTGVIRAIRLDNHALPKRIGRRALEFDPIPSPDGRLLTYFHRGSTYAQPLAGGKAKLVLRRGQIWDWSAH